MPPRPTSIPTGPDRRSSSRSTERPTTSPGTGKANPAAAIRSAALMLDFLGEHSASAKVTGAVEEFIVSHPDPSLSTTEIGDAIAERL